MPNKNKTKYEKDEIAVRKKLRELSAKVEKDKYEYQNFCASIKHLPPSEKSHKWLTFFANHLKDYVDQEAIIYLISRGHDCSKQIQEIIHDWREAKQHAIEECAAGSIMIRLDEKTGKRKTTRIGKMPLEKVSRIKDMPSYLLRNFWFGHRYDYELLDATMLRTVEWCEIGGFADWWERLAKERKRDIVTGGIEPVWGSYWLFNMTRSNYARQLMGAALIRTLDATEINDDGETPWEFEIYDERKGHYIKRIHHDYASTIIFANKLLRGEKQNKNLVESAAKLLLRNQQKKGSWSTWFDQEEPSILTTAKAIHALGILKSHGWNHAVEAACKWLWSIQNECGFWHEGKMSPVYLTVLVMDAIELGTGGNQLTFIDPRNKMRAVSKPLTQTSPRFQVALSFPGESRKEVEAVATSLAKHLKKEKIFYDNWYKSELARPNLDTYLYNIYEKESELVVVFLCKEYEKKEWCGLEWRAIRDLIKKRQDNIMPVRFDDTNISGFLSIDGYIDYNSHTPDDLANFIKERLDSL